MCVYINVFPWVNGWLGEKRVQSKGYLGEGLFLVDFYIVPSYYHDVFLSSSKAAVPNLFGTRDWFRGRQFFHRRWGVMVQAVMQAMESGR